MTRKILPVREKLSRLLDEAEDGHEPVMITRYGRLAAEDVLEPLGHKAPEVGMRREP